MGLVSFLLPPGVKPEQLRELERACMAGGPDNMPWPTEVHVDRDRLTLRRSVDESGYLVTPWQISGRGLLMGTSATLMERGEPYQLPLELARGKVNQLRSQAADWRAGGLEIPSPLNDAVAAASREFGRTVTQPDPRQAGVHAQDTITLAYVAAHQLVQAYVDQVFEIRHQRQTQLDTALGCSLGSATPAGDRATRFVRACNSAVLPLAWKDVEPTEGHCVWDTQDALLDWAEANGLSVSAGPLIDMSAARLPDWLWLYERDLPGLARFMTGYVDAAVRRYGRRIRRWQLTNAGNYASVLGLGEDELLWLTVRLVEAARQVDPGLEISTGIAQPWGEYMALEDRIHSPFIFADTLIRAGLNLSALDLELVMGVSPRGSYCRDLLETSRLLDLYALLGLPMRVTLGYPSASSSDALADPEQRVGAGAWNGGFTPATQADWVEAFTALVLCKPYVQAVHWTHFSDAEPHQFPYCGLLDAAGNPKPAFAKFCELRNQHVR
jgi:hypothetical protein